MKNTVQELTARLTGRGYEVGPERTTADGLRYEITNLPLVTIDGERRRMAGFTVMSGGTLVGWYLSYRVDTEFTLMDLDTDDEVDAFLAMLPDPIPWPFTPKPAVPCPRRFWSCHVWQWDDEAGQRYRLFVKFGAPEHSAAKALLKDLTVFAHRVSDTHWVKVDEYRYCAEVAFNADPAKLEELLRRWQVPFVLEDLRAYPYNLITPEDYDKKPY